jgi:hypothetical protein
MSNLIERVIVLFSPIIDSVITFTAAFFGAGVLGALSLSGGTTYIY